MSLESRMEALFTPAVLAAKPYKVQDGRGMIKLDAMENPYALSEDLRRAWLTVLANGAINRYPDPQASSLKSFLRAKLQLPDGVGLMFGNGSDELIQLLILAVAHSGRPIMGPEPSFVMYRIIAESLAIEHVGMPLTAEDFALDRDAWLEAIAARQPALIFLPYPNNPTGNLFSEEAIVDILNVASGFVVVDEAYAPFSDGASFVGKLGQYENLIVMRTFSKEGLAGLRLGMMLAPCTLINTLDRLRLPYNINVLTQLSAQFLLNEGKPELDKQVAEILSSRAELSEKLAQMPGLAVYPSSANFILFKVPAGRAGEIFSGLKVRKVLIKNVDGVPGLDDCLRVTVGTPEENVRFLEALGEVL